VADLRFGLVGTGFWAAQTHAPAIAATPDLVLASVWGRRADAADTLASRHGATGFTDFDAFLDTVDAVAFAAPPDVQSVLAVRAAEAGKHLLLEKPIAVSKAGADRLVTAVDEAGVASVVFHTILFDPRMRAIVADRPEQGWSGGAGLWLGSALRDENPFNTPWRREKGALWDLGPHALSVLWVTLGPIVGGSASRGEADLVHAVLRHESGATSTASMTLNAADPADGFSTLLWGETGRTQLPVDDVDEGAALRLALAELRDAASSGVTMHPSDVRFGRDIVAVLADLEAALDAPGAIR
jgi:predicted dehydrogenase